MLKRVNVAQVAIIALIMPGIFAIMGMLGAESVARETMLYCVSKISWASEILDTVLIGGNFKNMEVTDLFLEMLIGETLVVALCMKICGMVHKNLLKIDGAPILSSLIGAILATLIIKGNKSIPIWEIIFLVVLIFLVDLIWIRDEKNINLWMFAKDCSLYIIELTIKAISVVFLVGYVGVVYLAWRDGIEETKELFPLMLRALSYVLPWAILVAIDMHGLFKKEEKKGKDTRKTVCRPPKKGPGFIASFCKLWKKMLKLFRIKKDDA